MSWVTVYDLRSDTDRIHRVQQATLTTPEFGLKPEPALFASDAWWRAIEDRTLPVVQLEGHIDGIHWGSMGDWPEFTLVTSDGLRSSWTRLGDQTRYVTGLRARVCYVSQQFKDAAPHVPDLQSMDRVVLRIEVEDAPARSSAERTRSPQRLAI